MTGVAPDARPRLLRGVRLSEDRVRGGYTLLAPERVLKLKGTTVAVLTLCDGQRSFAQIVDELAQSYAADRALIERESAALLRDLAGKLMVEL